MTISGSQRPSIGRTPSDALVELLKPFGMLAPVALLVAAIAAGLYWFQQQAQQEYLVKLQMVNTGLIEMMEQARELSTSTVANANLTLDSYGKSKDLLDKQQIKLDAANAIAVEQSMRAQEAQEAKDHALNELVALRSQIIEAQEQRQQLQRELGGDFIALRNDVDVLLGLLTARSTALSNNEKTIVAKISSRYINPIAALQDFVQNPSSQTALKLRRSLLPLDRAQFDEFVKGSTDSIILWTRASSETSSQNGTYVGAIKCGTDSLGPCVFFGVYDRVYSVQVISKAFVVSVPSISSWNQDTRYLILIDFDGRAVTKSLTTRDFDGGTTWRVEDIGKDWVLTRGVVVHGQADALAVLDIHQFMAHYPELYKASMAQPWYEADKSNAVQARADGFDGAALCGVESPDIFGSALQAFAAMADASVSRDRVQQRAMCDDDEFDSYSWGTLATFVLQPNVRLTSVEPITTTSPATPEGTRITLRATDDDGLDVSKSYRLQRASKIERWKIGKDYPIE